MNRPLRIALLDHTATMGGGEIALFNLVTHLDRARFEPLVILFSDGPLREKLEQADVRVLVEPLDASIVGTRRESLGGKSLLRIGSVFRALGFARRISRLLVREDVDLVHTNSLKSDVLGGLAGRFAKIPVIWHVRDRIDDDYLPKMAVRFFRNLAKWLPSSIVANSAATMGTLKLPSSHAGATRVVHDGISIEQQSSFSQIENKVGPVISLVGRIAPWKGQDIFIRAAKLILDKNPTAHFQIIGAALFDEKQYETHCRELAQKSGFNAELQFLGFREDVQQLISAMDVLVHASTTGEPFGQVIIEGMAAGKPVVATNGGGVPEIVVDGVTGLLVPMGDESALAAAVCKLLDSPEIARSMGQAGLQRVRDHFTIERTAGGVQEVYTDLALRYGIITPKSPETPAPSKAVISSSS